MRLGLLALAPIAFSSAIAREFCEDSPPPLCATNQADVDPCCVPSPGRLELSQTWDEGRGRWTVDTIRVLSCDGQTEFKDCDPNRAYPPSKVQNLVEGYARHAIPLTEVSRSLGWGGIRPDASDDDVAAIWAQHWSHYGTCISTFLPACFNRSMPPGEEDAWNDPGPALFIKAIHQEQEALLNDKWPQPNEPRQVRRELPITGSLFLGTHKSKLAGPDGKSANQMTQKIGKLSFFANRDKERVMHQEKDFGGFHHEEL
ncbi:ribonuclease T2-like [Ceratobasidium sp. 428]|nr:ribonuclease T2-like [Ceratobasidium sp. 428]